MILEKFNKLHLEIQTEILISLNSVNISIKMNIIQVVRLQEQVYNQIENYQSNLPRQSQDFSQRGIFENNNR